MSSINFPFEIAGDQYQLTVPRESTYFEGHFPGNPLLPAYAIVDQSFQLLQKVTRNSNLKLASLSKAKFSHPIQPGDQCSVTCEFLTENICRVVWKVSKNQAEPAEAVSLTLACV